LKLGRERLAGQCTRAPRDFVAILRLHGLELYAVKKISLDAMSLEQSNWMNARKVQEESVENQPASLKQSDFQRLQNSHKCFQGCIKESKN
jgi:hypothetical protein